jgi:hypothetical protein
MRECQAPGRAHRVLLIVALALASAFGWGQQASPGPLSAADLAPFASRLKAETVNRQVKLTWRDAPDLKGVYLVYRATAEITPESLAGATLVGTVGSGVEFFIDTPPDQRGYFYALIIRDPAGTVYPLLIPFRNKTNSAVSMQTTAPAQELAARITGIRAAVSASGDGVDVTFVSSNPARSLLLFLGTAPLVTADSLSRFASTTPLDPGTTRYTLAALPGIDYWFAVLDAGLYKLGQVALAQGTNVTATPVRLPLSASKIAAAPRPGTRRILPLPTLVIPFGVQSGQRYADSGMVDTPPERNVSAATTKAIGRLLQGIARTPVVEPSPKVIPSDATPIPGSELTRLQQIVAGPFADGDMAGAQKQLLDFLGASHAPEVEAHARFYLGQTSYFLGRPRDALMEFLVAEDYYFQYTEPWKDACFQKLEAQGR